MTALAVAIVLCCAMVCGTFVVLAIRDERLALRLKDRSDLHGVATRVDSLERRERVLTQEVEQLRTSSALRSLS